MKQDTGPAYGRLAPLPAGKMAGPFLRLARHNQALNRQVPISGLVNGQALPPVRALRYGLADMAFSGCGVIAIYNALLLLGNPHSLSEVAAWSERHACALLGLFGTLPWRAGRLFRKLGYQVTAAADFRQMPACAAGADVCLFTYWNRRGRPWRGMHTVCLRCREGEIEVYNPFSLSPHPCRYAGFSEWRAAGVGPILLYGIKK